MAKLGTITLKGNVLNIGDSNTNLDQLYSKIASIPEFSDVTKDDLAGELTKNNIYFNQPAADSSTPESLPIEEPVTNKSLIVPPIKKKYSILEDILSGMTGQRDEGFMSTLNRGITGGVGKVLKSSGEIMPDTELLAQKLGLKDEGQTTQQGLLKTLEGLIGDSEKETEFEKQHSFAGPMTRGIGEFSPELIATVASPGNLAKNAVVKIPSFLEGLLGKQLGSKALANLSKAAQTSIGTAAGGAAKGLPPEETLSNVRDFVATEALLNPAVAGVGKAIDKTVMPLARGTKDILGSVMNKNIATGPIIEDVAKKWQKRKFGKITRSLEEEKGINLDKDIVGSNATEDFKRVFKDESAKYFQERNPLFSKYGENNADVSIIKDSVYKEIDDFILPNGTIDDSAISKAEFDDFEKAVNAVKSLDGMNLNMLAKKVRQWGKWFDKPKSPGQKIFTDLYFKGRDAIDSNLESLIKDSSVSNSPLIKQSEKELSGIIDENTLLQSQKSKIANDAKSQPLAGEKLKEQFSIMGKDISEKQKTSVLNQESVKSLIGDEKIKLGDEAKITVEEFGKARSQAAKNIQAEKMMKKILKSPENLINKGFSASETKQLLDLNPDLKNTIAQVQMKRFLNKGKKSSSSLAGELEDFGESGLEALFSPEEIAKLYKIAKMDNYHKPWVKNLMGLPKSTLNAATENSWIQKLIGAGISSDRK